MKILEIEEFVDLLNKFQEKNPKELIIDVEINDNDDIVLLVSKLFEECFEDMYSEFDLNSTVNNYIREKFL